MNNNDKRRLVDSVMSGLLMVGCPFDLGIPAWTLREMTTRSAFAVAPSALLGLDPDSAENNVISEYSEKRGYEFSWGTLSELVYEDEDGTLTGCFEVFPKDVLMTFPQPAMVEDLFVWMYQNHPLKHPLYYGDEAYGDWFVLSFTAYDIDAISALRHWLATTFVSKIMPDLVSEAMLAVTKELHVAQNGSVESGEVFVENIRHQLCGDPSNLSFNLREN